MHRKKETLTSKQILSAEDMKLNLQEYGLEFILDGITTLIPFNKMTPFEAALLRLQYAKEVILPGQNTAKFFKQEGNK